MKLYVMRHGPAEERADSGMDSDRALTASGRERVDAVARLLVEVEEEPLSVITSPLVRAVQTAELVARTTRLGDRGGTVEVRREMSPSGNPLALVHALAVEGRRRVMLVGHEPDLSELVAALLGDFRRSFDKAMVVSVQVDREASREAQRPASRETSGRPRMRFVLDPKALRLDPDRRLH
jgi:phosphohistidine phosphatase